MLPEHLRTAIGKLMPFSDQNPDDPARAVPYEIRDYLELVYWSGQAIVHGKRGSIPEHPPSIPERLNVDPQHYIRFIRKVDKSLFHEFIAPVEAMRELARSFGTSFLNGQTATAQHFSPG